MPAWIFAGPELRLSVCKRPPATDAATFEWMFWSLKRVTAGAASATPCPIADTSALPEPSARPRGPVPWNTMTQSGSFHLNLENGSTGSGMS